MKRSAQLIVLLTAVGGCNVGGTGLLPTDADVAASASSTPAQASTGSACSIPKTEAELSEEILRLVNIERFDIGAVEPEPKLAAVASEYACTMVDGRFFGHLEPKTNEGVVQRVERAGYPYVAVGENLAAGYWNPYEIVEAWMASEPHREIIMDPGFSAAGVSVRYGGEFGVYCVLILARSTE